MMERIRYRLLMYRLRKEIAAVVREQEPPRAENAKTARMTACKAFGTIV